MTEVNPKEDETPPRAEMANLTSSQRMNPSFSIALWEWLRRIGWDFSCRNFGGAARFDDDHGGKCHPSSSYIVIGSPIEGGKFSVV